MTREIHRVYSGAPWEKQVGYCAALRVGNHIYIKGTVAANEDGSTFAPGDPYAQAKRCFELIKQRLEDLDSGLERVVRTRMFVTDTSMWNEFGRAHQEFFGEHPPVTTLVEVKGLVAPDMLIEIEAEAIG